MKRNGRKWIKWLLSGVAFAAVAGSTGCGMFGSSYSQRNFPPAPIPVIDPPPINPLPELASNKPTAPSLQQLVNAPAPAPEPAATSQLNIFGEFNGAQHAPNRSSTEVNFTQQTFSDEGFDSDVSADAKGRWMVFSSTRNSPHQNLYKQKVDGVSVIQLTSDNADDAYPTFNPDGSKIAFCSNRSGNWDLYTMNADGSQIVQITRSSMQEIHPSFSPDGTRLVYSALNSRSDQWELWTIELATNAKRMIGYGLFPTWSPAAGKDQIAYQKARARGSRWFSVWTLDLIDNEAKQLTEVAVSSNAALVSPSWSPDGQQLAFATIVEPGRTSEGKPIGQQDVWTVNVDGTQRHRVTDGNGICATPFWSSDNKIFFVSNRSGNEAIWSAKLSGTTATAKVDTDDLQN